MQSKQDTVLSNSADKSVEELTKTLLTPEVRKVIEEAMEITPDKKGRTAIKDFLNLTSKNAK